MPRPRRKNGENSTLAQHLRSALASHRLTIREAAKIAGCAPSVFGGWLTGAFPGAETICSLARFCHHFGLSFEQVLTGSDESSPGVARNNIPKTDANRVPWVELQAPAGASDREPFFEGIAHVRILRVDVVTSRD